MTATRGFLKMRREDYLAALIIDAAMRWPDPGDTSPTSVQPGARVLSTPVLHAESPHDTTRTSPAQPLTVTAATSA